MPVDVNSVIAKEGGESEAWREMKDRTNESHSPILMQAILSLRKTSNLTSDTRDNTRRRITIDHLIHLNDHFNHLNRHWMKLQDLSQRWQNNTSTLLCKHYRKLEAHQDSRAEVLQSSSVLFTSIQVKMVLMQVSDVIDSNRSVTDGCN